MASLATIVFHGYHVGTFDQVAHLPFLAKYADSSLFPNDPFIDIRFSMYSFFWFPFLIPLKLGLLEPLMFIVHFIATYLTFTALWYLSRILFKNRLAAIFTILVFIIPHLGFAGFTVFEFSLLNRTFVLPFLLFAIIAFLRRRYVFSFFLLGLLYNLHVVSVNFVLAMFLFHLLLSKQFSRMVTGLIVFIPSALPVLIWRTTNSTLDLSVNWDWFHTIANSTIYNIFFLLSTYWPIVLTTSSGLAILLAYLLLRKQWHHQVIDHFVLCCGMILLFSEFASRFFPITLVIQSQISRAGVFILIIGFLYIAAFLAKLWTSHKQLGLCLLLSLFFGTITISLISNTTFALPVWYPGIHIYPLQTPWYHAQVWARDHTPTDSIFIVPPYQWWWYTSDWRVFSNRPTVSTLSELLVGAFIPNYLPYWQPRFEAVSPNTLSRFRGDYFANIALSQTAYSQLTLDQITAIATIYQASYLVTPVSQHYNLPIVYENSDYYIYQL